MALKTYCLEDCDMPQWYALRFINDTLIVEVPAFYDEFLQSELPDCEWIDRMRDGLELKDDFLGIQSIQSSGIAKWGFGGCAVQTVNADSTTMSVNLRQDHQEVASIAGTLAVLFNLLYLAEIEPRENGPCQVLSVNALYPPIGGEGSLGAILSPLFCGWIEKQDQKRVSGLVTGAMICAYSSIEGSTHDLESSFYTKISGPHWVSLTVPGNGCGLDPTNRSVNEGKGYRASTHNLDSCIQQLCLLCGLAKLYELAAESTYCAAPLE